jgi:hypothetical protein
METIELQVRDIFAKRSITDRDVRRANELIRVWKYWHKWEEATSNPIKAY